MSATRARSPAAAAMTGLLANIGAPREVPAIGSAIHTERLLAAVERKA